MECGNSATPDNSEGDGNLKTDHKDDNGRKYVYYKNDDGDKKVFYNAPLASLDRLTIKILDSRGRELGNVWGDTDVANIGTLNNIPLKLANNTFVKDEFYNVTDDIEGRVTAVTSYSSSGNSVLVTNPQNTVLPAPVGGINKLVVNLTNQIEYVFEVTTKKKIGCIFKAENL